MNLCKGCCSFSSCCCSSFLALIRQYSSRNKHRRKIVLLLVGLDNAGKSTAVKRLTRERTDSVLPTVGFNSVTLKHRGHSVIIYELGGSAQIRGIWPKYYASVHGIIFVVDASDLTRVDESRKALEELLAHDQIAGKPLLLLANKQDREGALDEIDMVERLNLESLVNVQKCPTMVQTCAAAGPPSGSDATMDPGIQNGYRWLCQRIILDYDRLNSRVEEDSAAQDAKEQTRRADWLCRQDTDHLVDSLPDENDENPFKDIQKLVKSSEQNGHVVKEGQSNGHVIPFSPLSESEDSPDSSSHSVQRKFIPLRSPSHSPPPLPAEPHINETHREPTPVDAVREQFEWKMHKQRKKKLLSRRSNRTAPSSAESDGSRVLPPLKTSQTCPWARPSTAKSLPARGWFAEPLEEVDPPPVRHRSEPRHRQGSPIEMNHRPPPNLPDSDNDDVVTGPHDVS